MSGGLAHRTTNKTEKEKQNMY